MRAKHYICAFLVIIHRSTLSDNPSASQIALSAPWRASAADQTFSVNRKYFIVSCICAQKQYLDFRSVILDLLKAGFALARLGGRRASDWGTMIGSTYPFIDFGPLDFRPLLHDSRSVLRTARWRAGKSTGMPSAGARARVCRSVL